MNESDSVDITNLKPDGGAKWIKPAEVTGYEALANDTRARIDARDKMHAINEGLDPNIALGLNRQSEPSSDAKKAADAIINRGKGSNQYRE